MTVERATLDRPPPKRAPARQMLVQEYVLDRIRTGRFKRRLPGIQKLAGDIGVNARTAQKAILALVAQGHLYQAPRSGTYVHSAAGLSRRGRRPLWKQTLCLGYSDGFNIGPALSRALDRALGANRNRVELVPMGGTHAEYVRFLDQARVLGRQLDVLLVAPAWMNGVAAHLEPLERFGPELLERTCGSMVPDVVGAFRANGQTLGLPLVFAPTMWTVNEALCAKAGLPLPARGWTWPDFARACDELAKASGGFGACLQNDGHTWIPFVLQNGGQVYDPETGRLRLHEPPALEALDFVLGLIHRRKTAVGVLGPHTKALDLFEHGVLGMHAANYYPGHEPRVPFLWRRVPPPVGKRAAVYFSATGLAVHRLCRAPDEAAALLDALGGEAAQAEFAYARCALPARQDVLRAPRLASMDPREADDVVAALAHAEFRAWAMEPQLEKQVAHELDLLWMGVLDLTAFARRVEQLQPQPAAAASGLSL